MSKSGQAYVAATQGHQFTMYSAMRALGIPLSDEQEKFQSHLERTYPAVVYEVHCGRCNWWGMKDQLYKKLSSSPSCPVCLSDKWLEYKEE